MDNGMALVGLAFLLGCWLVLAIVAGIVASHKRRYVEGWVVLVFLFAPTLLILLALNPLPDKKVP